MKNEVMTSDEIKILMDAAFHRRVDAAKDAIRSECAKGEDEGNYYRATCINAIARKCGRDTQATKSSEASYSPDDVVESSVQHDPEYAAGLRDGQVIGYMTRDAESTSESQPEQSQAHTCVGSPPPCGFCDTGLVFTEFEIDAIIDLGKRLDLSAAKVIKQALRTYQLQVLGTPELAKPSSSLPVGEGEAAERIWISKGRIYPMNPDNADLDSAPVEYRRVTTLPDHAQLSREIAEKVVTYLFENGMGQQADRLVLTKDISPKEHVDLGGWGKQSVKDCIIDIIEQSLAEQAQEKNQGKMGTNET